MSKKIIILFLLILTLPGCSLFKKKQADTTSQKEPINEPVNVIDVSERPYVTLTPRADGRELTLTLNTLPKSADEVEYELEYQAGSLLQGVFGSIVLSDAALPVSSKTLLGSCSAGGACSFHEDVNGGTLILKFRAQENYALKTEWRFHDTKEVKGLFGSRDSKLQLNAGTLLDKSNYVVVMQTSGLPTPLERNLLVGPYGIYTPTPITSTTDVTVSLKLGSDLEDVKIMGFDGTSWVELETAIKDQVATATDRLYSVYVATN